MFDLENFPTRELARDMMGMISPIYDNSYVGKWIFEVMSVPLSLAQDTINELREQAFPETATWSLPYWEQSYGLPTNEALSIEERRSRVISKRNYRKPMNPARIEMLLNANIHRVEERLKSLKAVKEKGTKETEFELFKVVENVEAMRLQIIFDGKPEADVRAVLKKHGFKWAPSQGAWQRMLNPAGKYALNRVKEELEVMQNDN